MLFLAVLTILGLAVGVAYVISGIAR